MTLIERLIDIIHQNDAAANRIIREAVPGTIAEAAAQVIKENNQKLRAALSAAVKRQLDREEG